MGLMGRIMAVVGGAGAVVGLALGALQLKDRWAAPALPRFDGPLTLNAFDNQPLIDFLDAQAGRVVFVDLAIDMSVSTASQSDIIYGCHGPDADAEDGLLAGYLFNRRIVLPVDAHWDEGVCHEAYTLEFDQSGGPVQTSHGGTGIVEASLRGYYEVARLARSGPSLAYTLRHLPAGVSELLEVNR